MIAIAILAVIAAYLLGSISFAVIFSKLFSNIDVRKKGSGNAGTTNVLRVSGKKAGMLTLLCDALKGTAACLLGAAVFSFAFGKDNEIIITYGKYLCGLFCMLGHAYPIFFGFKGGKCAATSVGVFIVCCPAAILLGVCTFAVTMLISKIVSLSTLTATVVVAAGSIYFNGFAKFGVEKTIIFITLLMAVVVVLRHKDNIKRLIHGEEKKLTIRK